MEGENFSFLTSNDTVDNFPSSLEPQKSCTSRRQQAPFRSLENTTGVHDNRFSIKTTATGLIMVCSQSLEDNSCQVNIEDCTKSVGVDENHHGSNCCSSVQEPCQEQNQCISGDRLHIPSVSFSSPKVAKRDLGMMVRSTNCHLKNIDQLVIHNSVENVDKKLLHSSNNKVRIRTDAFSDFYIVDEEIGRGKFAVVKRCRHRVSGLKYAAKFLRKRRKGKDCRADVMKEVHMLETVMAHPRLVNLIEVFETSHELIIVTEYAEGGELFQKVMMEEENFDEQEVQRLMRQILEAILFLHDRDIVHLDIKPQNVLLTTSNKGNIKLCDLGFARPISSKEDVRDIIGTPDYVAPEILSYEPIHTCSDMWSVGVLAYVMLTGCSPFAGDTKQETFLNISQGNLSFPQDLFSNISSMAIDFMKKLLVLCPEDRLTAKQCLQHPWLQSSFTPIGSPIGQRRTLSPPSPDSLGEEPVRKCRCQASTPVMSPESTPMMSPEVPTSTLQSPEQCLESAVDSQSSCDSSLKSLESSQETNDMEIAKRLSFDQTSEKCPDSQCNNETDTDAPSVEHSSLDDFKDSSLLLITSGEIPDTPEKSHFVCISLDLAVPGESCV